MFYMLGLILLVTFSTAVAAYLNFNMKAELAQAVLIMLSVQILLDFFLIRNLLCLLIALMLRCISTCKGSYRFLSMGGNLMKDIHNMMKEVIMECGDSDSESIINIKENYSIREESHEASDRQSASGENWADHQHSSPDLEGGMHQAEETQRHLMDSETVKGELKQDSTRRGDETLRADEPTLGGQDLYDLEHTRRYDDTLKYETRFYPSILNELGELNLLLLEKIYSTFEGKADKVFQYFRKDKYHHLKPKILEWVGNADVDLGKGMDNASESTILLDGS